MQTNRVEESLLKISLDIDSWCEMFTTQAQHSEHVFWISQLDYQKHLFVSPSFKQLWGVEATVMYETPTYFDTRLVSQDLPAFYQHALSRHHELGKGSVLFQIKNEQGELRWVRDRFMTLYDAQGTPLAAAGIAMDVTERIDTL